MGFRKGESGNPSGRPKGIQTQAKLRASIEKDLPEILLAMVEKARDGDVQAARLLLDRTMPALRPQDVPAALPLGEDLTQAGAAVLAGLGSGLIGTDQARDLAAVLSALSRVQETVELAARVAALEDRSEALKAQG